MEAARAREAMRAGAQGVAVIAAITAAREPQAAMLELERAIDEGRASSHRAPPALPRPTIGRD
jgi:thiamine monophosphate synthase